MGFVSDLFGGEEETQTTSQTSGPPTWMLPYIQDVMAQGQDLYNTQPLYSGPIFSPDEVAGYDQIRSVANNPLLLDPANAYAQSVIAGDYLDPIALRTAAEPLIGQALQGVRGGFEGLGGGSAGGATSMEALATGEGVTRAIADVYNRERQLQQGMAMAAPALEAARYAPGQMLADIGGAQFAREQQLYREPWERLGLYSSNIFGGSPARFAGVENVNEQTIYEPSPFQKILGGGLSIAGAASGLGWKPFG